MAKKRMETRRRKLDGGEKAFCHGIALVVDRDWAPGAGLGDFIHDCVRRALEARGLCYQDLGKPKMGKRRQERADA